METNTKQKEQITVEKGIYRQTTSPNAFLVTTGLESCVGIGFVSTLNNNKKIGLSHLFYDGTVEYKGEEAKLIKDDIIRVDNEIEDLIYSFTNVGGEIPLEKISAYVIANRINTRKVKGTEKIENFNLMSEYILNTLNALKKQGLNVYLDLETECKKFGAMNTRLHKIHWKDVIIRPEEVKIIYRDSKDIILNQKIFTPNLITQ
ncbi:MAG: hypothetical protein WCX73_03530 [Candidatus Pacearchaeota archaeon]|jgi:hypothetical protein